MLRRWRGFVEVKSAPIAHEVDDGSQCLPARRQRVVHRETSPLLSSFLDQSIRFQLTQLRHQDLGRDRRKQTKQIPRATFLVEQVANDRTFPAPANGLQCEIDGKFDGAACHYFTLPTRGPCRRAALLQYPSIETWLQKSKGDAHRAGLLCLCFILKLNMKTLVILAHPNIDESKINSAWMNGAAVSKADATIRNIYQLYPDEKIDVKLEQRLIAAHDAILLQFPFYWFSMPPLLKKWLDDVLAPGFAYGPNVADRKLTDMPVGFAVSAGIKSKDYESDGRSIYTVKELLAPLHATASYIGAKALEPFIFYGAEYDPSQEDLDASVKNYLSYLNALKNSALPEFAV